MDQILCKVKQALIGLLPIDPRDLVILAISIVIALLGTTQFIACYQHGHTLREEKCSEEVALLFFPKGQNGPVVCRSFQPAVPGAVVALAVFPVMLFIIRYHIA